MALSNETGPVTSTVLKDLSAQNVMPVLFAFYNILWPIQIIAGTAGNVVNIIVFLKIGLKESVTVSLMALSISDLVYLILAAAITVMVNVATSPLSKNLVVSLHTLAGYVSSYQIMAFYTSMGITTYIAVARCCCVAMPLKFKHVFTVQRTTIILCLIALICVVSRIPYLSQTGFMWVTDSRTNSTRLTGWYSDNYQSYRAVKDLLNQTIYPVSVLGIVSVCSAILLNALVRASRLRQEMTGDRGMRSERPKPSSQLSPQWHTDLKVSGEGKLDDQETHPGDSTLSAKEVRVVQAVMLVTLFLLITVLIMSARAVAYVVLPGLAPGQSLSNIGFIVNAIEFTISYLNASINVAIYYKYNSKFYETIWTIIRFTRA